MSDFSIYFQLGLEHIADFAAYDHMLFIVSLCAIYTWKEWKKVLILVTAFTIGHSVTLALAVLNLVNINRDLVETLIPITIIVTCLINIFQSRNRKQSFGVWIHYLLALFFGLIHGLGFANYLKSLLMGMGSIFTPLLSFNLGIEVGQIAIVAIYLLISVLIAKLIGLSHQVMTISISIFCAIVAIYLLF